MRRGEYFFPPCIREEAANRYVGYQVSHTTLAYFVLLLVFKPYEHAYQNNLEFLLQVVYEGIMLGGVIIYMVSGARPAPTANATQTDFAHVFADIRREYKDSLGNNDDGEEVHCTAVEITPHHVRSSGMGKGKKVGGAA